MKKIFLVLAMVFILAGVALPCEVPAQTATSTATATATGGTATGGSATIQKGAVQNSNSNLNVNTNVFDPTSVNIQGQMMNNKQTISPVQETVITTPQALLNLPSQGVPELNFGSGRMKDVTTFTPNFAIYGIERLGAESIREVLNVNANVKFKNLYKAVLLDAKGIAEAKGFKSGEVKYQIIRAEAQKTWTTGGNIGGGGSALASSGLGGVSAAGSLIPQFGGTKADDLFTIIFVRVAL